MLLRGPFESGEEVESGITDSPRYLGAIKLIDKVANGMPDVLWISPSYTIKVRIGIAKLLSVLERRRGPDLVVSLVKRFEG